MTGRTQEILKNLRTSPMFCELIAQESQSGWPLPKRVKTDDGNYQVYLRVLYFSCVPVKDQMGSGILPPNSIVTIAWKNQKPVQYLDLNYSPLFRDIKSDEILGKFPHEAVAHLKRDEYINLSNELFSMYDDLLDTLTLGGALPPFWEKRFQEHFSLLTEPPLHPYYRKIAPKFCNKFLR